MKKLKFSLLLIIMMLCLADNTYAQKQKIDIKMVVLDAKQNGNNISDLYLKRKQFLTIYNNEDNELLFANVSGVNDDQSFGDMFGTETKDYAVPRF